MNIKEFMLFEKGMKISFDDWDEIKKLIYKMQLRIEDLEISRDNWKAKYQESKKVVLSK